LSSLGSSPSGMFLFQFLVVKLIELFVFLQFFSTIGLSDSFVFNLLDWCGFDWTFFRESLRFFLHLVLLNRLLFGGWLFEIKSLFGTDVDLIIQVLFLETWLHFNRTDWVLIFGFCIGLLPWFIYKAKDFFVSFKGEFSFQFREFWLGKLTKISSFLRTFYSWSLHCINNKNCANIGSNQN